VIRSLTLVPLAAIIGGCIMSLRHFRAAYDNINARGGAAGYRFGRMALYSEVLVQGSAGAAATGHSR